MVPLCYSPANEVERKKRIEFGGVLRRTAAPPTGKFRRRLHSRRDREFNHDIDIKLRAAPLRERVRGDGDSDGASGGCQEYFEGWEMRRVHCDRSPGPLEFRTVATGAGDQEASISCEHFEDYETRVDAKC